MSKADEEAGRCPTCSASHGHKPWCGTSAPDTRQKNKQNFKKRDDDGRSRGKGKR